MTPEQIDRVFGRGRLKMVTGEHVEVFREAAEAGSRRRYTKRFLTTVDADFGQWTEREWRILARLIGHGIDCVPEVVQYDRGAMGGTRLVQTYDAGATVDQWATILPVSRGGRVLSHVFEDCAHWWALAHHCLRALFAIHELSVVHLDIKGDNVCVPVGPPDFDPHGPVLHLYPRFGELALIDFAFALVSRERLTTALPIGWQADYDYQSPRLLRALEAGRAGDLQPTRELDWRCDMYSLAAMLARYLPDDGAHDPARGAGWSRARAAEARELIGALREAHDRDASQSRPHQALMESTAARLAEPDIAASLAAGWTLARDASVTPVAPSPLTPLTRLAPRIRVMVSPRAEAIERVPAVLRKRPPPASAPRSRAKATAIGVALTAIGAFAATQLWDRVFPREDPPATAQSEAPAPPPAEAPPPAAAREEIKRVAPEAPPARVAEAPPPTPKVQPPAVRAAPTAAKPAVKPSRPTTVATAKPAPPPAKTVAPAPAQPRIRFFEEPVRVASAAPPETPPAEPTPAPPAKAGPASPAPASPAPAAPRPAQRTMPGSELHGILALLFDMGARPDRGKAPIEDRAVQSQPAPQPQPAPRSEPVRVAPPPIDVTFAAKPEPAPVPPVPAAPSDPPPVRDPAPRAVPPSPVAIDRAPPPEPAVDFALQARRALAESVPQSAARAEADVQRVLLVAANARERADERNIVDAVHGAWQDRQIVTSAEVISPAVARKLSEDARQAFMVQRDVAQAFVLQLRAFGANPRDAEAAGNLAFLYLKLAPPQPETARVVAMHALALSAAQLRPSRVDDWNTFAVASALTGRETDAINALYVTVALTRSLDLTCKSALSAVDAYGDRLVAPVQAMMLRIRQQGRDHESPYCASPPRWRAAKGWF
jgi:hypothetical protein